MGIRASPGIAVDDDLLEVLKEELICGQKLAVDEDERVLVWIGNTETAPPPQAPTPQPPLLSKEQKRTMLSLYEVCCERFDRWLDEEGKVCKHDFPVHHCPHCPAWRTWVGFFTRGLALIALASIVITIVMTILGWGLPISFKWVPQPWRFLLWLTPILLGLGFWWEAFRDHAGQYGCMLCGAILVYVVYPESLQIAGRLSDDIVDSLGVFFGGLILCVAGFGIGFFLMLIGFVAISPFMGCYYWIVDIRRRNP